MLKNKKILVCGAAGLLGCEVVKKILENEGVVIAADIDLLRLHSKLKTLVCDSGVEFRELDLTSEDEIKFFFENLEFIDGVVNCTYPRNSNYGNHFFDVKQKDFNENLSLNIGSSFLLMQQCAEYFKKNKRKLSLVNVSSVYGSIAPNFDVYENTSMTMPVEYAAIKSALIHLSKYVTKYVSSSDFRINVVSPGGILDGQPKEFLAAYKNETLGRGMLQAKDVVGTVVFLLSSMSEYINGQNVIVDDGFVL